MDSEKPSAIEDFRLEVMMNLAGGDLNLDVVDMDGRTPVVVALDEEPLATLMLRVANIGGFANVFSRGLGTIRQVSVVRAESSLFEADSDDMTVDQPSGAVTVGAFLDYVSTQTNGVTIPAILKSAAGATLRDAKAVQFS